MIHLSNKATYTFFFHLLCGCIIYLKEEKVCHLPILPNFSSDYTKERENFVFYFFSCANNPSHFTFP